MSATEPRLSREELARRGDETFTRLVRPALRPEDDGKFVAVDVESGDYELDEDDHAAVSRLHRRLPGGTGLARPGRVSGRPPDSRRPVIRGTVTAGREPIIRLRVRGPSGFGMDVDFVVDTGFTGSLALPVAVVIALGLPWQSGGVAVLADGSTQQTDYYEAEVEWVAGWRTVLAMSVGPESLLGVRMLAGHRLVVEGSPGGAAEIVPWP